MEKYGKLFDFAKSYTTRPMKADEEQGVQYRFIRESEFEERFKKGEFIEIVEHWGAKYGTTHAEIERIKSEKKIPLIEVDFKGANGLKSMAANFVFIYPPTITEL